jgi:putative colanic acid biosynthesis glycosyltransferase WcaI
LNILVLSINYTPEPTGFAPHVAYLCEHLADKGHSVKVITGFSFAPYWSRYKQYRRKFYMRERISHVEVHRLTHFIPKKPRQMIQRLLMESSFSLIAALILLVRKSFKTDIIIYVGAQPSIAMVARLVAWWKGVPYAVFINDLAAQAAVDVETVKAKWLGKILETFEYAAYRYATGAIVLCPSFKKALEAHQYPASRVRVIPSPVDLDIIRPVNDGHAFREALGLKSFDFVVLYSGSMGLKQGLTNVIEAALLLRDENPTVKWVLVGNGELKPMIEKKINKYGLPGCVRLLPLQPESEMSGMFSSADLLLLNQLSSVKDTVIPSKLLTYMAAGKPVLAAVNPNSQAADLIQESRGGILVPPEDPGVLAAAVRNLQENPATLQEMGKRNRAYAVEHFDQRKILAVQEAFLFEMVNRNLLSHSSKI